MIGPLPRYPPNFGKHQRPVRARDLPVSRFEERVDGYLSRSVLDEQRARRGTREAVV